MKDPDDVRYPIMLNKHEIVELLRHGQYGTAFMERIVGEWNVQAKWDAEPEPDSEAL